MELTLQIALVSGGVALLLAVLFLIEQRRGRRFGETVRGFLDRRAEALVRRGQILVHHITFGVIRISFHYLLNRLLATLEYAFGAVYARLGRWRQRNRRIVRAVKADRASSHLAAVRVHKESVALTDEEKNALRDKRLAGE